MGFSLAAILVFESIIDLAGRADSDPVVLAVFGIGLFLCGAALRPVARIDKLREDDTTVSGGGLDKPARIKAAKEVPEEVASN